MPGRKRFCFRLFIQVAIPIALGFYLNACSDSTQLKDNKKISKEEGRVEYPFLSIDDDVRMHGPKSKPKTFEELIEASDNAFDSIEYLRAMELAEQAIKLKPESGRAHFLKARAMYSSLEVKEEDALREFQRALDYGYKDYRIYQYIAEIFANKKDFQNSILYLSKAIEAKPTERVLYKFRASTYQELNDNKNAETDYGNLIKYSGRYKKTAGHISRGQFYESIGKADKALEDYNKAYSYISEKKDSPQRKIAPLKKRVPLLLKKGYEKQAIKDLSELISINSFDDDSYKLRGDLYFKAGDYEKALKDYSTVIDSSPDSNAHVYKARSDLYKKLGKKKLADLDLKKAKTIKEKPAEKTLFKIQRTK